MTHPEISNELEILSNVHYPLEFPTGITTPDDAIGQQIPEISSGSVSIQQIFHPNISQPYPLLPISITDHFSINSQQSQILLDHFLLHL
ncbi:hypothetical protein F8M41_023047 [Gigaspora margarita]|uniref:Uncharacterized protein n=1 Tax=Gigaspora margarita TaxID=4874 RepID=A0A8H4EHK9_GIGMA|nr:hypothetical protein F8M41_023047 [Gigaspora margarita]